MQRASRLKRELSLLTTEPPPGITCWQNENQLDDLRARTYPSGGTSLCVRGALEFAARSGFPGWQVLYRLHGSMEFREKLGGFFVLI